MFLLNNSERGYFISCTKLLCLLTLLIIFNLQHGLAFNQNTTYLQLCAVTELSNNLGGLSTFLALPLFNTFVFMLIVVFSCYESPTWLYGMLLPLFCTKVLFLDYFNFHTLNTYCFSNSLLGNALMRVHPILLYGCAAIALVTPFNFVIFKLKILTKLNKTEVSFFLNTSMRNLLVFKLSILSLLFGSWWALQVGTWGGWWNWDSSEFLLLLLVFWLLLLIHLGTKVLTGSGLALPLLSAACFFIGYKVLVTWLLGSGLHSFFTASGAFLDDFYTKQPFLLVTFTCSLLRLGLRTERVYALTPPGNFFTNLCITIMLIILSFSTLYSVSKAFTDFFIEMSLFFILVWSQYLNSIFTKVPAHLVPACFILFLLTLTPSAPTNSIENLISLDFAGIALSFFDIFKVETLLQLGSSTLLIETYSPWSLVFTFIFESLNLFLHALAGLSSVCIPYSQFLVDFDVVLALALLALL